MSTKKAADIKKKRAGREGSKIENVEKLGELIDNLKETFRWQNRLLGEMSRTYNQIARGDKT